ncbi:MAG: glycosyltransferase family 2 protein [Bacillus sp. (in: Bacteria)]|nr:glycosyltransferase family 2 protein [Bacillus sp. (in: firmicutes)]MCM1425620.1 glycosyltransferase family 2 protein [Eubacterium sp.]
MKTTIIIPNYNGMEYLEKCLRSLENEKAHVIVVDNGSTDDSFDMVCSKFPKVECVSFLSNTGFSKAVNAGLASARTEYVIFLNNDTEVESGFVVALEEVLDKDDTIFSASAKMLSMNEKDKIDDAGDLYCAFGWAYAIGKGEPAQNYRKSYPVFAACGGAAIYRKEVFDEIGGLDENHFAYLEDIDLGYRAQIYGYRNVYAPKARVYHMGSATSGSRYNPFKVKLSARNSVYLIYKNMPLLQILLNLPFLIVGYTLKTLFFMRKGLGMTYMKGVCEGFRLSASSEGKKEKVRFRFRHLGAYINIQFSLWANMIKMVKIANIVRH